MCVSTQVGCAVGCPFCATGRMGLRRSCTAAEVVDQVRAAATALHARGLGPVTHVVYMGMGEPLAAYDTTVDSLRVLVADGGISARRITVSTSGVVPAIHRLAGEGIGCTLAVSLHAATDELRDRLVPLNRAHPLAELVAAASRLRAHHRAAAHLRVVPDRRGQRRRSTRPAACASIARRAHAHVNVIPMNHIDDSPWGPPDRGHRARVPRRSSTAWWSPCATPVAPTPTRRAASSAPRSSSGAASARTAPCRRRAASRAGLSAETMADDAALMDIALAAGGAGRLCDQPQPDGGRGGGPGRRGGRGGTPRSRRRGARRGRRARARRRGGHGRRPAS